MEKLAATGSRIRSTHEHFILDLAKVRNAENAGMEHRVQRQIAEYELTRQDVEKELKILGEAAKTDKTG